MRFTIRKEFASFCNNKASTSLVLQELIALFKLRSRETNSAATICF